MSTIDDLQEKLNKAQNKFNDIVNELSSFASLKEALDSSDKGIKEAAGHLEELTKVLESSANALNHSADTMKEIIDALKKTDPILIKRYLSKVLEESNLLLKRLFHSVNDSRLANSSLLEEMNSRISSLEKKMMKIKISLKPSRKEKGFFFK